ncbi:quinone-dependent dihydroorotate dehydrogenase [Sphingomonas sp. Y38-1Y]|uniref:quinone-dependent dihydroorotate dehydrogenase n=1 Tax=Sphingomonas sp. Y38-1Y TaxID=3078265 RepID=UPI0028EB6ABB|nr:quinone-dependent dihydroorotate dehydrogenase [Sphingomonas sp. Y38-1Y]
MPAPFYRPALFALDPEAAHRLTIRMLSAWGKAGTPFAPSVTAAPVRIAGLDFPNPVGLAAGVDKDAEAIAGFLALGFGFVEVGTLTPRPQSGNPKPRLFRLVEDEGVVNRMGFNNGGIDAALPRIAAARRRHGLLGINVGANKDSENRIADYAAAVAKAAPLGDYVTINISSPNTPGLRDLQSQPALSELIAASSEARLVGGKRVPLFLKIAPDLDRGGLDIVARAAIDGGIDALIVSNTTISRPDTLRSANAREAGGLSGQPLAPLARQMLVAARAATGGSLPLISAGGIGSAEEAQARLDAGASLVQIYSALVFQGPGLAARIVRGLRR